MLRSLVYSLSGATMLGSVINASPFMKPHQETHTLNIGGHIVRPDRPNVQERGIFDDIFGVSDGGRWPPEPLDFPFPANTSANANTEAGPGVIPPDIDAENEDQEVHTYKEISKAFIDGSCSQDQKTLILAAWHEARTLANAQTGFEFGYDYDIPHTDWLGVDWNSESSWIPWRKDFRKRNQDNWGRLRSVFSQNAPRNDYIYFYCTDWNNKCKDDKGEADAYTNSFNGHILWWNNHYITFCPKWFTRKTLASTIDRYKGNKHEQKKMENFQGTSGGILFHEMWHLSPLVSQPWCADRTYAFDAQSVWDLAKNSGTWYATENADSYHLDAMAIYVQQQYQSGRSPVPLRELRNTDAEAYAAVENDPPEDPVITKFEFMDANSPPPEAGQRNPDPNKWEEITYMIWKDTPQPPPPPPQPTKSLSIVTDFKTDFNDLDDLAEYGKLHWKFFQADYSTLADCRTDTAATFDQDIDLTQPGPFYPIGNFKMGLFGEDCEYQSGDKNPGKLVCNGNEIECVDDPADKNPLDPNADKGNHPCGDFTRQPVFLCSW